MEVTKYDYNFESFNENCVEELLVKLGLSNNNYFFAITKPSLIDRLVVGNILEFANRYCFLCFSESKITMIMLSRLNSKKVTEIITLNHDEIKSVDFSNVFISYKMKIKTENSTMNFQVLKKVRNFNKIADSIELFKKYYL